jgi:hypothetical protein
MKWSYGAVAFIDVLGFSSFVEADARSVEPARLLKLKCLLAGVKSESPELDVRAFSDSIIISAPLESAAVAKLINATMDLQSRFVSGGVLVRGGIAFGKHYGDETLIYSEALIRAYQLERDRARFPRILVANDLLDWYFHHQETKPADVDAVKAVLLADRDNSVFIDYLDAESIESHLQVVNTYNVENATPSVLEKIQWLCQYHNFAAERVCSPHVYAGAMLSGFQQLVIKP